MYTLYDRFEYDKSIQSGTDNYRVENWLMKWLILINQIQAHGIGVIQCMLLFCTWYLTSRVLQTFKQTETRKY